VALAKDIVMIANLAQILFMRSSFDPVQVKIELIFPQRSEVFFRPYYVSEDFSLPKIQIRLDILINFHRLFLTCIDVAIIFNYQKPQF
jgi:hypothetical protein